MHEQRCEGKKLNSIFGEQVQQGVKMKSLLSWSDVDTPSPSPPKTDTTFQNEVQGHLCKEVVETIFNLESHPHSKS